MPRAKVLIVDDKESVLELMSSILHDTCDVTTISDPAKAIGIVEHGHFDVVLTDIRMPCATGFDVLAAAKRSAYDPSVVMMTGFASIPDAVAAMRLGAFDYVAKPLEADDVCLVIARALEHSANRPQRATQSHPAATEFKEAMIAARDRASRDYLVALMRDYLGNVTRAAMHAGMTREGLHRLLKKYRVRSEDFRPPGR